jgi:hypothetical protein
MSTPLAIATSALGIVLVMLAVEMPRRRTAHAVGLAGLLIAFAPLLIR